jgi:Spy/CpxP family protein refolding chaperone
VWIALLVSVGVNVGVLATLGTARFRAQPRWERPGEMGPPPFGRLADRLGLAGKTREQFLEVQRALFETVRRDRQRLEEVRASLRRELTAEQPEQARVERQLEELGDIHAAIDRALVESVLASRDLLSPEQQRHYLRVLDRMRDLAAAQRDRGAPPPRRRPARRHP